MWAGVIFAGSSIHGNDLPNLEILGTDKLIHLSVFYCFGLLVYMAMEPKTKINSFPSGRILLMIAITVLYGILDEVHQGFVPGRTVDSWDVAADALGGMLAAVSIMMRLRRRAKSRNDPA